MRDYQTFEEGDPQRERGFSDTILLKYPLNGDSKIGIINLNLSYDFDKDELDYLHIEYSDDEIKSFVDKNPSLLGKIDSLRREKREIV